MTTEMAESNAIMTTRMAEVNAKMTGEVLKTMHTTKRVIVDFLYYLTTNKMPNDVCSDPILTSLIRVWNVFNQDHKFRQGVNGARDILQMDEVNHEYSKDMVYHIFLSYVHINKVSWDHIVFAIAILGVLAESKCDSCLNLASLFANVFADAIANHCNGWGTFSHFVNEKELQQKRIEQRRVNFISNCILVGTGVAMIYTMYNLHTI